MHNVCCSGCEWQNAKVVCGLKSDFVNLDLTQSSVVNKKIQNRIFDNKTADEERSRPNYMTRERCGDVRGCTPCDKNLTGLNVDGCLVPLKTGPQEWFGMKMVLLRE